MPSRPVPCFGHGPPVARAAADAPEVDAVQEHRQFAGLAVHERVLELLRQEDELDKAIALVTGKTVEKRPGVKRPCVTPANQKAYLKGMCHTSFSTIRKLLRDVFHITISRGQPQQRPDHELRIHPMLHLDLQALTRKLILHRQYPQLPARLRAILQEVIRPHVVGILRLTRHASEETTSQFYLKVGEGDYSRAAGITAAVPPAAPTTDKNQKSAA